MSLAEMKFLPAILLLISLFAMGCAAQGAPATLQSSPDESAWMTHLGGLAAANYQSRAQATAQSLFAHCRGRELTITVLKFEDPAAYSWRNGRIFVSSGLMDRLTDSELEAALAHELGHMLSDGQVRAVSALSGNNSNLDVEERADELGTDLLRSCAIPTAAMPDMLKKVAASSSLSTATKNSIARRVQLLESRLTSSGLR